MKTRLQRFIPAFGVALVLSGALAASAESSLNVLEAARTGNNELLRAALNAGGNVNERQPDGATPVSWAVHRDDLEMVDALIGVHADLNAANDYGITPLHLACQNENGA